MSHMRPGKKRLLGTITHSGSSKRGMRSGPLETLLLRGTLLVSVLLGGPVLAQSRSFTHERFVAAAREVLGVPYDLGGRLRDPEDGIDCQGVLFYAAERVGTCGWKSFSVMPTKSVPTGELGSALQDMAPVASSELDVSKLQPGDVLLLVGFSENP